MAFSAAEGNVLLARVNEYLAADAARAEQTVAAAPTATVATVAAEATAAPAIADTTTMAHDDDAGAFAATHVVPASGLLAWVHPDPDEEPTAQLAAGVELRVVAESGAWARVEAANGWAGWVDGRALQPR